MAKKSKLLSALDAHQGRDHQLERQKKLQKKAAKKKRSNVSTASLEDGSGEGQNIVTKMQPEAVSDEWESEESEEISTAVC